VVALEEVVISIDLVLLFVVCCLRRRLSSLLIASGVNFECALLFETHRYYSMNQLERDTQLNVSSSNEYLFLLYVVYAIGQRRTAGSGVLLVISGVRTGVHGPPWSVSVKSRNSGFQPASDLRSSQSWSRLQH
jgi:hypothetical protein